MQPPIFVLTLKGASGRGKNLLQQLDRMGLNYELWFGVDGRRGLLPEYEAMIDRAGARKKLYRDIADAEFACALSHNAIYRTIVERGYSSAVILEDDARVGESFRDWMTDHQQPHCELLLLDHRKGGVSRRSTLDLGGGLIGYRVVLPPELTTGYYLTGAAAQKMIELSGKISSVADWPCDISELDCRAILPRLVSQPPAEIGASQIQGQRQHLRAERRSRRFLTYAYWKRWWLKHTSKKLT